MIDEPKPITVAQLVEHLQPLPQDLPIGVKEDTWPILALTELPEIWANGRNEKRCVVFNASGYHLP